MGCLEWIVEGGFETADPGAGVVVWVEIREEGSNYC